MLAIVGGLGAALVFATVTLCNSRSTRMIGPATAARLGDADRARDHAPVAFARGIPDGLDAEAGAWMAVAGVGNVVGLLLAYSALRVGKVGIARRRSTQGADRGADREIAGEQVGAGRRDPSGGHRHRASGWPPSRRPRRPGAQPPPGQAGHRLLGRGRRGDRLEPVCDRPGERGAPGGMGVAALPGDRRARRHAAAR